jgi:hypothetical protein
LLDCYEDSYLSTPRICILLMRIGENEYVRVDLANFYHRRRRLRFHESATDSEMTEVLIKQKPDIYSYVNVGRCPRIAGIILHEVPESLEVIPIAMLSSEDVNLECEQIPFSQESVSSGEVQTVHMLLKDRSDEWDFFVSELMLTFDPKQSHPNCISIQFKYERGHTLALNHTFYCTQDLICLIDDEAYLALNIGFRSDLQGSRRHEFARDDLRIFEDITVSDDESIVDDEDDRDCENPSQNFHRPKSPVGSMFSIYSKHSTKSMRSSKSYPPSKWGVLAGSRHHSTGKFNLSNMPPEVHEDAQSSDLLGILDATILSESDPFAED